MLLQSNYFIPQGVGGALLNAPNSVYVSGVTAYVASTGSNALEVISLYSPAPPVAIAATNTSGTSFTANWNAVAGSTNYFIDVATDAGFSSIISGYNNLSVTTNSVVVTGLTSGTTYYYRIRSTDASGGSRSSNSIEVSPPLIYVASPANGAVNENVTLTISSNIVNGATTYTIEISPDNTFATGVLPNTPGAHTQTFSGLAYSTTYYARVMTNLSSLWGKTTTFATASPEYFTYVTSPTINAVNESVSLTVNSNVVIGATTYTIEISPDNTFTTGVLPNTPGGHSQSFTGLSYGTTYYTRVKTDLSPNFGKTTSFTTATSDYFSYVTTPANNAINTNVTLTISSNAVVGATTYEIDISPDNTFTTGVITNSGSHSMSFSGLAFSTTYYTRVKTNLSPTYGKTTSFTTASPVYFSYVSMPMNGATGVAISPKVTSMTVTGATTYTIDLSEDNTFTSGVISMSGTQSQTFTGLYYGKKYYARVATDLSPGNYGKTTSFTTETGASQCYVTSPANSAVNVSWDPTVNVHNLGPMSYTLQLSTTSDFSSIAAAQTTSATSFKFTGLSYGTPYYSRVTCDSAYGVWGPTRTFTTGTPESYSYITSPANGATNVSYVTNVTANLVPDATSYTIELNTDPLFESGVSIVKTPTVSPLQTIGFTLDYDQTYYARVYTDLTPGSWGTTIKSFTTGDPLSLAYVTSPKNGGTGVPTTVIVYSNPVPGATSYTIELNTSPDFSGASIVKTSTMRYISFNGLGQDQIYYTRVQTNLEPGQWGNTSTSFTTINPAARSTDDWVGDTGDEQPIVFGPAQADVFPVPFHDKLTLHLQTDQQDQMAIHLYDLNGKDAGLYSGMTNSMIELKPNQLAAGIYIIRIVTSTEVIVRKIIKL
jgi:hypothetical protein